MKEINDFMQIYMFELEKYLYQKKEELQKVSFQSDEANTDRPLKEFLKNLIENSFNSIPPNTNIKEVIFENGISSNIEHLKKIKINRVLLPDEITDDIKSIVRKSKNSIYTNPDICLELVIEQKKYYETIELKSTKQDSIPGSSIQQITPDEWVIFIKHSKNEINIVTGQYIHAVNSKMQFPDRSPRPQVSFKEMQNWNKMNRVIKYQSLIYNKDLNEEEKYALINDWQNVLSKRWIDMLFNSNIPKGNEPWFNNNMRKFIISFLEKYEQLTQEEKELFKTRIKSLIKDE